MIIINKNADFSGCGLGKIIFKVSNEVNKLLDSLYDNLDFKYKLIFQQFIDDIGYTLHGLVDIIYHTFADERGRILFHHSEHTDATINVLLACHTSHLG